MLGKNDDYYPVCKPLIENIETKSKIAVVSYLVLLESIHVLRHKITKNLEFKGGSRSECQSKIPIVKSLIKEFIKTINEFSKQGKILIPRPQGAIFEHHSTVLKKMNDYFGYVRTMSICPLCEKGYVTRDSENICPSCGKKHESIKEYQYKGLGHADLEHAYLAKNTGSVVFYSTDKSFKELNGDPDFGAMSFEIVPHPDTLQ